MKIVVLEGPDFAGKTTRAESIATALGGAEIEHLGQPGDEPSLFAHYVDLVMVANAKPTPTIFDRLHVGEFIYGPRYRGKSRLSKEQLISIGQLLDELGALKIHVDAPDHVLLSRFRGTRGDDLVDKETDLLEIADDYRSLFGGSAPSEKQWVRLGPGDSVNQLLH